MEAKGSIWDRFKAGIGDLHATLFAQTVAAVLDPLQGSNAPIAISTHPMMNATPPTGTGYTKNRRPVASQT
jgi:hypothetical protein